MFDQLFTIPQPIQDEMIDTNAHTYTHASRTGCELVIAALKQSELAHFLDHAVVWTLILLHLSLWSDINTFSGILRNTAFALWLLLWLHIQPGNGVNASMKTGYSGRFQSTNFI
jgi:hypothetical protein